MSKPPQSITLLLFNYSTVMLYPYKISCFHCFLQLILTHFMYIIIIWIISTGFMLNCCATLHINVSKHDELWLNIKWSFFCKTLNAVTFKFKRFITTEIKPLESTIQDIHYPKWEDSSSVVPSALKNWVSLGRRSPLKREVTPLSPVRV